MTSAINQNQDPFQDAVPCWLSGRLHKFEHAGLGKGPFHFMGVEERRYRAHPDAPSQPGGCCAYCGEGIVECCIIRDSLGSVFIVGNVCVGKTGDAGLINLTKKAINRIRREATVAREKERIAAARITLADDAIRAKLEAEPHPYDWQAAKGLTRLSWALWMMDHAGNAGRMEVVRYIDKLR